MTKEELIKENAVLEEKIKNWVKEDLSCRTTLSELLNSYEYKESEEYAYTKSKKQLYIRDWLGIAFLIGELKADANYAMCIQAREDLKVENQFLTEKIRRLENPDELGQQKKL